MAEREEKKNSLSGKIFQKKNGGWERGEKNLGRGRGVAGPEVGGASGRGFHLTGPRIPLGETACVDPEHKHPGLRWFLLPVMKLTALYRLQAHGRETLGEFGD